MEYTIKQFATYEISLLLKELGFNEKCMACYSPHMGNGIFELIKEGTSNERSCFNSRFINSGAVNGCSSPLWQQVIDWLRTEHDLHLHFHYNTKGYFPLWIEGDNLPDDCDILFSERYKTFPDVREKSVLKAIEIIKTRLL